MTIEQRVEMMTLQRTAQHHRKEAEKVRKEAQKLFLKADELEDLARTAADKADKLASR